MRAWYEAELTSTDGNSVLTIASHWHMSEPSPPTSALSMPWVEGYLAATADIGGTMVDLGRVSNQPLADERAWSPSALRDLLVSLILEPEHLSERVLRSGGEGLGDYSRGIVNAHGGVASPPSVAVPTTSSAVVITGAAASAFEIVNAAIFQPYIPKETSPPAFDTLVNLAGVGGGLGLGVLIAAGAVAPIALLTVPGGLIAFGVGQGLKRRLRALVDPLPKALREIRDLERKGMVTKTQADRMVEEELASRSK